MDTVYTCYKITNLKNGKLYIGQTSKTIEDRWKRHVGTALWNTADDKNVHALHKAIRKYGPENFSIEVIATTCSATDVNSLEAKYIIELDTRVSGKRGYNMTLGGEGTAGYIFTEQDREIMAAAQRGKVRGPRSNADKQKISNAHKQSGHKPSLLCIQRRQEECTGIPRSEEVKERIRATLKGRKRPPEVIEKIRQTKALKRASSA